MAVGRRHVLVIHADGTVAAVGWNGAGQCEVEGWRIAAGERRTVGVLGAGRVLAVGRPREIYRG